MFKLNSGFRWTSTDSESTTATLTFPQQNSDCDIEDKEHSHSHTNNDVAKSLGEQQLENVLSNLLKYGVLIASAVVLFGGIVYLVNHGTEPTEYDYFHGEPSQFCSPMGILRILSGSDTRFDLRDRAIIQFGLLLLIATPIIRVIISLLSFLRMRDFTYVIITSLVLSALAYSLIGAYI